MPNHLYSYQSWRNKRTERRAPLFSRRTSSFNGRPPFRFKSTLRNILTIIGVAILGAAILGLGIIAWASRDLPDPNRLTIRDVPLSTKLYDRTGEHLLYEVHGNEKRTLIELSDIPPYTIKATLAAEDRNFYEHRGFSLTGIARSLLKNITSGSRVGGSTITQQLVKNAILTGEKTYTRKVKELILAYQIERKYSKDDILKLYFNEIPYGSVVYGIESASQTFFGKKAKDLTLAESAILAAIPQAPTYYSPFGNNQDKLITRQKWILDSMAELGYVTPEEVEAAKKEELHFVQKMENIFAPHFVMYVREYLSERYGEKAVGEGGLRVTTSLDWDKQQFAEKAIADQVEKNKKWNASNAALVSLDPRTGEVLAMVGSIDFFNEEIDGQVNVALRPRQPGSSFKPIVYAAAFKKGYTPETVVFDTATKFLNSDGNTYEPKNYNLKEHGPVTLREALAGSLNIPAVKVIYLTGIDKVLDLADELGYTTLKERYRFGLSLVLGGGEVKLLEHTSAFGIFAREGEFFPAAPVLKVEDRDGNVLEEFKPEGRKVLETQVARKLDSILSDNSARAYIFGENNMLTLPDRPVAAKTGTTNDYHDAWTMGFTPSLVTGVWVGNNDSTEMKRGADGSIVAAPIWNAYMRQATKDMPIEGFIPPDPDLPDNPALNGSLKQGVKVRVDRITGKLATELTPPELVEERYYRQLHDILYYVDKDNPRGPQPTNPASDPQFIAWEDGVRAWGEKNNIIAENPPTESDDVHRPEYRPSISIIVPSYGQTIEDRNVTFDVTASSPRGVSRVAYYLNGRLVGERTGPGFALNVNLDNNDIPNGKVTLRAVAYDDAGNNNQTFIDLNMNLPSITPGVSWAQPKDGSIITQDGFPLKFNVNLARPQNVDSVAIYLQKSNGSSEFINNIRQISGSTASIPWTNYPGTGIYSLYAVVKNRDGYSYQSDLITLEIK